MTTDITELAQREKFEAWVMTQICISKSTLEGLRTADGYRNSTLSGTDYNRLWSLYQSAASEQVEALEKAQTKAIEQGRTACELFDEVTALRQRIAELESRTVKLPKPISVLHRREFTGAHCAIYAYPEAEVNAALDDAGIKVEAE